MTQELIKIRHGEAALLRGSNFWCHSRESGNPEKTLKISKII
ncbi:hypothetical protein [Rickettsia endosymbiont of Polydrusus tereticollis]